MSTLNAHAFEFTTLEGKPLKLADFSGKVMLVVNTASHCGFTPQYAALQKLHETYRNKNLAVIGVPSNNFGHQEFAKEEDIKCFVDKNFAVSFTLTTITDIKGKGAHPFYQWARTQTGMLGTPKWNFHKYLISREGELLTWFASTTSPTSAKVIAALEKALAA